MDLYFEFIRTVDNSRYRNGNGIRLVNLGPIALFSNFILTTSSGKHLEDIISAHLPSLMYKLINSSKHSDDLSKGFDRSRNRRRDKLAQNKNIKKEISCKKYTQRRLRICRMSRKGNIWLRL